eukprot:CAMPEP_0194705872 /NCGR_PEP_ID=MMETSP0295-20121207/29219_1 /TAXON_ID=39354 /ORGANISM="Heterosigma akashiwo, Strain CCMP2393" /LENGTH=162 /DNA_ID=CAMNT_0039601695 /DNA_START=64 /DNA_END=552 /DNA_ORIENTATION=+
MPELLWLVFSLATSICLAAARGEVCHQYSQEIEAPCVKVISRNENYEIRRYGESREDVWTNAHIASDSWSQVQSQGFYKNFDTSGARTYAALLFPGFAAEADWPAREAELRAALAADGVAVKPGDEEWGVVYAGYDSPFVLFNRHNEVWIEVEENAAIMLDK